MTTAPIALTMGDPAGVGPELSLVAWHALQDELPFFLVGDPAALPDGAKFQEISSPGEAASATSLPVLADKMAVPAIAGQPALENASAVIRWIERAVDLAQSGAASALCTNPISKQILREGAGFAYPGHTEFLAALAGQDDVVMMLACDALKVVPATIHIPLAEVPAALNPHDLRRVLEITHAALIRDFGVASPRLAVAGLNPHAGEGGHMGREEIELIAPLLDTMRAEGMQIAGPLPGDTMFHPPARARYDAAICMYHDQALIPIKTLDFAGGVNVSLGLPFLRSSPDHGTAFDIAGKGVADASSLIAALRMANQMARHRAAA
ncbi:4-hydroxythreonine-4-phosphate dehydrogenase [Actibacterium mucosum KCTC 23349]|uniref:4-hydroxythreonine-4-phosphate dehydrogenase n=1 Tax=Actibacterium mucosum KCTC 23349 TaxID=1454373 RepID=A0A037ZHK7_9RHOB|nr:4-hydroxythreonine-4-phosphate dehydrogenase PdxA [Actibacterium mucosum]KAJ55623.1 4-hydroxythreonine-4-phosphate dehydrogenase [Actibacterium mucosum KCTC 23349]